MKNLQVYTLFFVIRIKKFYIIKTSIFITLRYADCLCDIKDCKVSISSFELVMYGNSLILYLVFLI